MATFTGEEQLDLLIKKLFYGVAKGGSSDNYNFTNEVHDSFLAVKPSNIWTNAASIPSSPQSTTDTTVEVYTLNPVTDQNAPLQLTPVALAGNAGTYSNFRKQWVALDGSDDRLKNWIGPGYGGAYAVRVFVGGASWDGTDSDATAKGIQEISFGSNAAADWFFDYEAGVLFWTNENLAEGVTGDFQQSVNFTTDTSLIANGDVVYIKAYRYIGGTGLGSATSVTVADSNASTNFEIVFTAGASSDAALLVDSATPITYNPNTGTLTTPILSATASLATTALVVGGNTTLGDDAAADTVIFSSRINSDFVPNANNSWDLGSSVLKWAEVHATTFTGDLTGDVTGNVSGSSGSTTGNAATATALAASVDIGGVSFDGSAGIDLPGVNTAGNQNTSGNAATATAIAGGVLGSVPYQSNAGATAFLAGNTAATNLFMRSVGDGTDAAAPSFAAIAAADVTGLGTLATANISVAEATAVAHKVVLTTADAAGNFTGVQIDTADLTFTPSAATGRGLLTTGDLTVKGNLNVIGDGTYINLQKENIYINDAVVTLGYIDATNDDDFTNGTAAGVNVGIEAYKQGTSDSNPTLVYNITNDYWAIDNKDHAASALTRVARVYKLAYTITSTDVTNEYFTITHQLNHRDVIVQVRDSTHNIIFFTYTSQTVNTVRVAIGGGITAGNQFNVVVVG